MRTSLHLLLASTLFATAAAFTMAPQASHAANTTASQAAPAKTRTPQQQRMADCSHQAKAEGRKGPERRSFMSTCLKGSKTTASTKPTHKAKAKVKTVAAVTDTES